MNPDFNRRSAQVRGAKVAYRRRCESGEITIEDALRDCRETLTLGHLLMSFKRWGMVRAEKLARDANIVSLDIHMGGDSKRTVTDAERRRLIDALHGKRAERAALMMIVSERQNDEELLARLLAAGCNVDQVAKFFAVSKREASNRIWRVRMGKAA